MIDQTIPNSDLKAAVTAALARPGERVQRVTVGQNHYWVKRIETLDLHMRLIKGNPKTGFERERAALKFLAEKSVPVPLIAAEGDDFMVLTDVGPSLYHIVGNRSTPPSERTRALVAAAQALAKLHSKDIAHGRPAIRDLSFLNGKISFLDFENFIPATATERRKFRDLLIFTHSLYLWSTHHQDDIDTCLATYRAAQPQVWQSAVGWCHRNRWINTVTRPLQTMKKRGKDFRPIPYLFKTFE